MALTIKKGDILTPKTGRKSSNGLYFNNVIKMVALGPVKHNYDYREYVEVLCSLTNSTKQQKFSIFTDSIEVGREDIMYGSYEIY